MAVVLCLSGIIHAGPIQIENVSADAKWVAHVDIERFVSSKIGALILEELQAKGLKRKFAAFREVFGFYPSEDLRSITLYGNQYQPHKGVLIIKGTFDKEKLLILIRANDTYQEQDYKGRAIHEWIDKGEEHYGSFYKDDVIVIANSKKNVHKGLDVMDGNSGNLADNAESSDFQLAPPGVFLTAAARGISEQAAVPPKAMILKMADRLILAVGEVEGNDYIRVVLKARDETAANQIQQMLQGIIAFGTMMGEQNPQLAELAQAVQLTLNGTRVKLRLTQPAEKIFDFLKVMHAKKQQKKEPSTN